MSEIRVPMDPCNPGHFYACCGLLELFSLENAAVESRFELNGDSARRGAFLIRSESELELQTLLRNLKDAKLAYLEPEENSAERYERSVRPVVLTINSKDFTLDWWFDWFRERTKDLKCWAGQVTTEKLMKELQFCLPPDSTPDALFQIPEMMKTKFGVDPRSAWSSLDVGYSPNAHNQDAATFPAVELFGAIGLQGFRPYLKRREDVRFHLWKTWMGKIPSRRAATFPWPGLDKASFTFQIAKRGQSYKYFTFAKPTENES